MGEEYLRKWLCAECMKMCCLGGKNSVVKGLNKYKNSSPSIYLAGGIERAMLT